MPRMCEASMIILRESFRHTHTHTHTHRERERGVHAVDVQSKRGLYFSPCVDRPLDIILILRTAKQILASLKWQPPLKREGRTQRKDPVRRGHEDERKGKIEVWSHLYGTDVSHRRTRHLHCAVPALAHVVFVMPSALPFITVPESSM